MGIRAVQNLIDFFRRKKQHKLEMLKKNNTIEIAPSCQNYELNIEGRGNTVIIKDNTFARTKVSVYIYGDNNSVIIDESVYIDLLNIVMGSKEKTLGKICNSSFHIGAKTGLQGIDYTALNSNTFCNIGADCMIAFDVKMFNTDGHPIFDNDTGKIINRVKGIEIGNHCWIAAHTSILKNSVLPDNSILGWGAVFSGSKNTETNCAFAGNPAKVVKRNVRWAVDGSGCGYVENIQD